MYQQGKQSQLQQALNHLRLFAINIYLSLGATRRKSTRVVESGLLDENPPDTVIRGYSAKIHPNSRFGATRRKSTRDGTFEATQRKSTRIATSGLLVENPHELIYCILFGPMTQ
jgi:hypothetical protein